MNGELFYERFKEILKQMGVDWNEKDKIIKGQLTFIRKNKYQSFEIKQKL